jgi:type VI secretion system VgrG family protein
MVHGAQTAIVVGRKDEDIWTDEYGRVELQFHWDRQSPGDENSSCWVRVAQLWAGIGQEVIVEFLEGDPDQPIVTGRVYNFDNKPPYELPINQTQSGIKSRSSLDGLPDNFNEIHLTPKDLSVSATKVAVDGSGAGKLDLDATGAQMSGPKAMVEGKATAQVSAPIVKVN